MIKYPNKKYKKIFNDVYAIYSYILSPSEIEKLTNSIFQLLKIDNKVNQNDINENDILLITYADTIFTNNKKPLKVLNDFLNKFIKNSINIIHILPYYPSSSDGGFAVIDFFSIDNRFGNWNDIKKLSKNYKIMSDIVLNHASSKSKWFKNFLKEKGEGKDFFLYVDKGSDTKNVVRARSHKLIQEFCTTTGVKYLWCTFSRDQIDFDFKNPKVLLMFIKIVLFLQNKGVEIFRFDAVAFI